MTRTRFAPALTGHLSVFGARVALANFLLARHRGGQFLLRVDDIDRSRVKPAYAEAIAQDLRWLGIDWDDSIHQSDRAAFYDSAAGRLKQAGRLYPCFESEEELRAKRDRRLRRNQPAIYDRAMLKMTPAQRAAAEAGGKRPYWRFLLSDTVVEWPDMLLGRRQTKLASLSDPVLIRADGTPLQTFTSVVDDIETGITHVIRDEDQLTNTAIQLDLMAALGADPRRLGLAHLPRLADADAKPPSVRSLRNDGVEAGAIAACLARLDTSDDTRKLPISVAVRFDPAQLLALNRGVLRDLPFAAVADRLPSGATETFWLAIRGHIDLLNEARGWWDVVAGTIVPPVIDGEQQFLHAALEALPQEPWNGTVWAAWTAAIRRATDRDEGSLELPLRLALTGEDQGPDLRDLLPLMGRARAAHRLRIAAA